MSCYCHPISSALPLPSPQAHEMLAGERASLQAILGTDTVRCPRPLGVATDPVSGRVVLVTDFLRMRGLRGRAAQLGEQIAR